MRRRSFVCSVAGFSLASAVGALGCDDSGKKSEAVAVECLDILVPLVDRDAGQVRKGVPEGVKLMQKKLPADPAGSVQELQKAIKDTRGAVDDLSFAKVTFFAFASPEGVVIRNETDPDRLVEQNVFKAFPGLDKAKDPKAGVVEAYGKMEAVRGVKKGEDIAWIVAQGIEVDGQTKGVLVTGWSMRLYIRVLEQQLVAKLTEKVKEKGQNNVPVAYVFIVKGTEAFGDPDRADELTATITKLDVLAKTGGGDFKAAQEIEKRQFGIAARRVPALGDDAAIVVAASVF
ncbi:MAG: hypothetical protein JNL21_02045 [Myxococcales bacterium]|nr:hypothetical protein [Myxococcales bacterium]